MRLAKYEYLPEDGVYYGEIPPLAGVWATGETVEDCQRELREVLEEWVALRRRWGLSLLVIDMSSSMSESRLIPRSRVGLLVDRLQV